MYLKTISFFILLAFCYACAPSNEAPEVFVELMQLETDLVLFKENKVDHENAHIFTMGTSIQLELWEVDFKVNRLKVEINGKQGWLDLETFKSLELVNSMLTGNCGAG